MRWRLRCPIEGTAFKASGGAGIAWRGVGVTAGMPLSATRAARSAKSEARTISL